MDFRIIENLFCIHAQFLFSASIFSCLAPKGLMKKILSHIILNQ